MPENPDTLREGVWAELENETKEVGVKQRTTKRSRPDAPASSASKRVNYTGWKMLIWTLPSVMSAAMA